MVLDFRTLVRQEVMTDLCNWGLLEAKHFCYKKNSFCLVISEKWALATCYGPHTYIVVVTVLQCLKMPIPLVACICWGERRSWSV